MQQKNILAEIRPKTIRLDPEALRQKFEQKYKAGYEDGSKRIMVRLEEMSTELQRALRHRCSKEFARGVEMLFHGLVIVIEQENSALADVRMLGDEPEKQSADILSKLGGGRYAAGTAS